MKKIFMCVFASLICACVYNMVRVSCAYGIQIVEDFNGYDIGNSIIGSSKGTDPGWSGPWGNDDYLSFTCAAGPVGKFTINKDY